MGKQSRRVRNGDAAATATAPRTLPNDQHPFFASEFRPIVLSADLLAQHVVSTFQTLAKDGWLEEWQLGRKGTHISSRFTTAGGVQDTLTSPDPGDDDFASLARAHIRRALELITQELAAGDDRRASGRHVANEI